MSEQRYDIFFRGETLEGADLATVKNNVGQLFKAPPEKVEQLFSGKVIALKKGLDKTSAAKFQQALKKAGARIYVKLAETPAAAQPASQAPAQPVASTTAATSTAAPAESAPEKQPEQAADSLDILPPGSDILSEGERTEVEAVDVDTSNIHLANQFDNPVIEETPPPPAPDVSHISVAEAGVDVLEDVEHLPPPPAPDVEHISVAAPGEDLGELHEDIPLPAPDVDHISVAPPGEELPHIEKAPPPPPPNTSHLHIE